MQDFLDFNFGELFWMALTVIAAFAITELLFWILNTVVFKAVFGEPEVPRVINRLRKIGYRIGFICLLLGGNLNFVSHSLKGEMPNLIVNHQYIQLALLFIAAGTVVFVLGKWYRAIERRRL